MLLWKRMPKAMEPGLETAKDWVRPATRKGPTSPAVNSVYASPPVILCCEMATASPQPSQPLVLVTELPLAVVLTRLVHVTAWQLLGDGVGAADGGGVGAGAGAGAGAGRGAGPRAGGPARATAPPT